MHFVNCAALAAVLFTENLRLYFCWGWIVLNLFLNFEQNRPCVLIKLFLYKKVYRRFTKFWVQADLTKI